jgi:D-3-phosphoglycerate dehydrogenase
VPIILVTDHPAPTTEIEARLVDEIGGELLVATTGDEPELVALAADADAILTCFRKVTPAVVAAAPKLRVIGRYGVGLDNIAVDDASARGVPVTNVPTYCVEEVADHAMALLLTLARGTAVYDASVRAGGWDIATGMPLHRIRGRTLGVVGFGHIGRQVVSRARAFGMDVLVSDRSATDDEVAAHGATLTDLDDLLGRSDAVSLHVPLDASTRHLLDRRRLALMRPGAVLINCARGAVVDLEALTAALRSGRLGGAGLDVFDPERLPADHPIIGLRNTVLTPHVAFYSEESIVELQTRATQNVIDVLSGRMPQHVANAAALR